jgi:hypothetical protein
LRQATLLKSNFQLLGEISQPNHRVVILDIDSELAMV